jgi:putative oxidoreductase
VHGGMKLYGGMEGTAGFFGAIGIPAPVLMAWAVATIELFGGVLLVLGLFTAPAALLLTAVMLGAIGTVHWANGFLAQNGGWEFNLALIGGLVAVLLEGPGAWALSRRVARGARVDAVPGATLRRATAA